MLLTIICIRNCSRVNDGIRFYFAEKIFERNRVRQVLTMKCYSVKIELRVMNNALHFPILCGGFANIITKKTACACEQKFLQARINSASVNCKNFRLRQS